MQKMQGVRDTLKDSAPRTLDAQPHTDATPVAAKGIFQRMHDTWWGGQAGVAATGGPYGGKKGWHATSVRWPSSSFRGLLLR